MRCDNSTRTKHEENNATKAWQHDTQRTDSMTSSLLPSFVPKVRETKLPELFGLPWHWPIPTFWTTMASLWLGLSDTQWCRLCPKEFAIPIPILCSNVANTSKFNSTKEQTKRYALTVFPGRLKSKLTYRVCLSKAIGLCSKLTLAVTIGCELNGPRVVVPCLFSPFGSPSSFPQAVA